MAGHTSSKAARSRAVTKYIKKSLDRIEIRFPKDLGLKDEIIRHTAITKESLNAFITRAIIETMDNDAWTEGVFPPQVEAELRKEFNERHSKELEYDKKTQ